MNRPPHEPLSPDRRLTADERALVWTKPPTHAESDEERRISREVRRNWHRGDLKIATILLEGDAGSGKTQLAKALSANFGLPYTKITCFADMDKTDVIGAILPVIAPERQQGLEPDDRTALQALYASDGFRGAGELIADALGLTPESASARLKRLIGLVSAQAGGEAVAYRFYPSEIVRAFERGYLLEIQEPTVIRDAAVLMALNAALEPDGALNLPTGLLRRHPDFVAVITTNRGYAGVRPLNEALRDRVQHAEKMDLPAREVMIGRAAAKTGCRDIRALGTLADVILALDRTAKAHAIKGVAGMRSYFAWADAVADGVDARETLYTKVIYKISTDPEEVKLLEEALAQGGLFRELEDLDAATAREPRDGGEPSDRRRETRAAETEPDSEKEMDIEKEMKIKQEMEKETKIEIKTWGAAESVLEDGSEPEADGERALALKRSADSEDGSSGASAKDAAMERSDREEDGAPRVHGAGQDEASAEEVKQREKAFRRQLNQEARGAVEGSMHQGVKLVVHRPGFDEADERAYGRLRAELLPVVREIAAQTLPLLEHEQAPDFARHQFYGARFQADSAARRDFRHFAKKRPPSDSPSLAVGLRIDESGSMAAFGRLEAARRAAVAVYEFCAMCGIPVLIYGDTADVSRLEQMSVYAYADPAGPDAGDRFRLMGIRARGNNRDGMALRIAADRLAGMPQSAKLLISVSDGQPKAMDDYAGERAARDMRAAISDYERKGVAFVAAAIGQDKEIIGRIYGGERFLDIAKLEDLPAKLVRIVARHL
ncbi:AAA family ATPase [Paenibacillus sp. MWE-103]|uniref:AAA family ATPase n=1 Tax=Paenibacillus artemisiicola TaxID=1172618 RepID=A0ABS3W342_9BACL|nr:AAA family ATPase [Paenibacillus artemisiicola]MBO7742700.1 AAA family ATPase [Paenibacillus artemisiicola]